MADTLIATWDEVDGGWVARCPQRPGAWAQGDTCREALAALEDVLHEIDRGTDG